MRDWTKAMAALLAAVSSVGVVQAISAQETGTAPAPTTAPTAPAVKADEKDPFAQTTAAPAAPATSGQDLSKDQVNVTDLGTVEIHVKDQNILDILRMLSLQTKKNIIPTRGVQGTVTADLYNVSVREALDAILHANGYAYREKGNFIYVYTTKEAADVDKAERKLQTKVYHLNYVPGGTVMEMIKPVLSGEGPAPSVYKETNFQISGESKTVEFSSHASQEVIVVTDYADRISEIDRLVKEIDRRPQQILVEATILQVKLTDDNSLGVDFSLLGGVDFSSVGSTNTAVLANNATGNTSGTLANGSANANQLTPAAAFSENGYNAVGTNVKGAQNQGLNIGVAYNNIGLFVNALEAVTDTVVLANPKVLTLNRQPGVVIVGKKDGYYTTTVTQTSTVQSVEYLETGTRLIFQPFIADDGFITMRIHPEDSTGGLNQLGLPFKQTAEVTTNVLVKDGHTIVIGGLFREDSSITKSQVPLLGDIPYAGVLFRSQRDVSARQEVIILITPHVIKDNAAYAELSEEQMKEADLMRVGIRKGMMPWSRDRLAEMAYTKAREEMSQSYYDRDKAMWYLDCATNLRPMFREALVLKEKVSGEQLMMSDDSSIRHFLRDTVLDDRRTPMMEPATQPITLPVSPVTQPGVSAVVTPAMPLTPADQIRVTETNPTTAPAVVPAGTPAADGTTGQ